jgi:hypothetical protein
MADLCLVPHFASSVMLVKTDLAEFPTCKRIFDACMELAAFSETQPSRQLDYSPGH